MNADEIFKKQVDDRKGDNKLDYFYLTILFPIFVGILTTFTKDIYEYDIWLAVGCWFFLLLTYIPYAFRKFPTFHDINELIYLKKSDEKEIENLKQIITSSESSFKKYDQLIAELERHKITALTLRSIASDYIQLIEEGSKDITSIREMLDEIFIPLYMKGDVYLSLEISEAWNFGLYIYCPEIEELHPIWRRKSLSHPSIGLGRVWKPGEGHVGHSFLKKEAIFTGDETAPEIRKFTRPNHGKLLEYDDEIYVSFVSIPIMLDNISEPYGVFVATSNVKNRFNDESVVEILKHFTDTIAVIFTLGDLNMSCLIEEINESSMNTRSGE